MCTVFKINYVLHCLKIDVIVINVIKYYIVSCIILHPCKYCGFQQFIFLNFSQYENVEKKGSSLERY